MPSKKRTIVVVSGYWSTNIGNSFFQLGAKYLLEKVFPDDRVVMLSDQPGFWNVSIGNPKNAFNLIDHITPDFLVILGPFLRLEYKQIWHSTLLNMKKKGVKVIIIGAGMMRYNNYEIDLCRKFLKETPPFIFASRDKETFDNFSDLAEYAYDGIDPAFFVSDIFEPVPTNFDNYIALNFDQIPEPHISISDTMPQNGLFTEFNRKWWSLKFSSWRLTLCRKIKIFPFIDAFLPAREFPENIGGFNIVRTDHRFNPMVLKKSYRAKNSFVSDIPFTYLNIYANSKATFSNRVHACVATIAYGNPAMLISTTPRARLLERVGIPEITKKLEIGSQKFLLREKTNLIAFIKNIIDTKN